MAKRTNETATTSATAQVGNELAAVKATITSETNTLAERLRTAILESGTIVRGKGDAVALATKLGAVQNLMKVLAGQLNQRVIAGNAEIIAAAEADSAELGDLRKETNSKREEVRHAGLVRLADGLVDLLGQPGTTALVDRMLTAEGAYTSREEYDLTETVNALMVRIQERDRCTGERRRVGPVPKSAPTLPAGAGTGAWLRTLTAEEVVTMSDALVEHAIAHPELY